MLLLEQSCAMKFLNKAKTNMLRIILESNGLQNYITRISVFVNIHLKSFLASSTWLKFTPITEEHYLIFWCIWSSAFSICFIELEKWFMNRSVPNSNQIYNSAFRHFAEYLT